MREEARLPRIDEFRAMMDAILAKPKDREELMEVAAICSRGIIQATTQATLMLNESHPDDDVLITPAEVVREFGPSLHAVRKAIREGRLRTYNAERRNVKVRRGDARGLVGGRQIGSAH